MGSTTVSPKLEILNPKLSTLAMGESVEVNTAESLTFPTWS